MGQARKQYTTEFKRKVALEAIKGEKTTNQITTEYGVHSTQVKQWKKQALDSMNNAFSTKGNKKEAEAQATIDELHRQLGKVTAERDWLQKKPLKLT